MTLLQAAGLVKQYGRRTVVNGVDIDVDSGEIVGLLGPNGAGKTTTFRMIVGMISPKAGQVFFNGHDVTHRAMYQRARLGLGYLAQDSSVFRKLTVEQNLHAILQLMTTRQGKRFRSTLRQRRQRVAELLEQFRISHLRSSVATTLSGGERRRLEIARCLVSEPLLIMLDEPFTGIDPRTVGDIQEIVRELRDQGIGVLITDHHVRETLKITDRSYLIADGQVITHGTASDIITHEKAREVYLGHSFDDAGLASPPSPVSSSVPNTVAAVVGSEHAKELIAALAGPTAAEAAKQLQQHGTHVVPDLLSAMQWNDPVIRASSHQILTSVTGLSLPFDPEAVELVRLRQIVAIRERLERRRAS